VAQNSIGADTTALGSTQRIEITGSRSLAYEAGGRSGITEREGADGSTLRLFADGYGVVGLDDKIDQFIPMDMSSLGVATPLGGSALAPQEYQRVVDRAATLQWDYDAPGAWHDFKSALGETFGMAVDRVRTPAQQAELEALQGIVETRVRSQANPEAYSLTDLRLTVATQSVVGAATVAATVNADERTQRYAALTAMHLGQLSGALGSAGAAKGDLAALRWQGVQGTARPFSVSGAQQRPNNLDIAKELSALAAKVEPKVTPALQAMAEANGGRMVGLDARLKTVESMTRKLNDFPDRRINDALRYTMTFDEANFTGGVRTVMDSMSQQGYKLQSSRNTFKDGEPYKGINATYRTKDGLDFELQFHTPRSFDMKDRVNHPLYEQQRQVDSTTSTWIKLREQMIQNSNTVPVPSGAGDINPRKR
jgi:hypothetical protein